MSFTVSELGVLLLILFGLFHWLAIFAALRAVAAFLGVILIGTAGAIGRMAAAAGQWAQHALGSATNWAAGAPVAAGLFIIVAVIVVHDLHPRNSAGRRTGWLALALGVLVVAGVNGIPALAGLRGAIVSGVGSAVTAANQALGGG